MNVNAGRTGVVGTAVLAFALAQACGNTSNSSSTVAPNAGAGGANGGAGGITLSVGGASSHAGAGGIPNAAGGTTGSAGGAGASAQGGNGAIGGSGGAGGGTNCPAEMARLSGIWDSAAWQESYALYPGFEVYTGASGALWQYHSLLNNDGYLLLRGQGANPKGDGMSHAVSVMFETPSVGPAPAGWYCSSSGSALTDDKIETRVMLENLGRLGACGEGMAVSGQISVCNADLGFPADCTFTRSGTIDGTTVTMANWDGTQGTRDDDIDLLYPDGMVISYLRVNPFDPSGPDTNGIVILPDGTIYCAGAASAHVDANEQIIDTLTDFKRLGRCGNITGTNNAQGCLGEP